LTGGGWAEGSRFVPLGLNDISDLESGTNDEMFCTVGDNGTVLRTYYTSYPPYVEIKPKPSPYDLLAVKAFEDITTADIHVTTCGKSSEYFTSDDNGISWSSHPVSPTPSGTVVLEDLVDNPSTIRECTGYEYHLDVTTSSVVLDNCVFTGTSSLSPPTPAIRLHGIDYAGSHYFLVGDGGTILRSTSTGWANVTAINAPKLNDVSMLNSTEGFAIGDNGYVYSTTNGGASWSQVSLGIFTALNDIEMIPGSSPAAGYIVGAGGVFYSLNSSGVWVNDYSSLGAPSAIDLNRIFYDRASNTIMIVGDNGSTFINTGSSWSYYQIPTAASCDLNSCFITGPYKFVVGNSGRMWKFSPNPTPVWNELLTSTSITWPLAVYSASNNLFDVYFRDQLTGYVCGENGTILKTTDGGVTWAKPNDIYSTTMTSADFHHFDLGSSYTGVVGGANGNSTFFINDESDLFGFRYWYDQFGRLIMSQNSKQFNNARRGGHAYSYTRYDGLGRIMEVGELEMSDDMRLYQNYHGVIPTSDYDNIYSDAVIANKTFQVTKTIYTEETLTSLAGFTQENLRGRVSSVSFDNNDDHVADYTSYFSYDIHGNVKTVVQKDPHLGYKRIDYTYDLISGNVKEIAYQANQRDAFYHSYFYDADNRLTSVNTSKDKLIWDKDARYMYYRHGPLARMEVGDLKVQGVDFAYTLQGWIKGINSDLVADGYDQGKDGCLASRFASGPGGPEPYNSSKHDLHTKIAKDVFGYSLGYFDNFQGYSGSDYTLVSNEADYIPVSGTDKVFLSNIDPLTNVSNNQGSNSKYAVESPNLFNGNIKHMVTTIQPSGTSAPVLTGYYYDQLNRINTMFAYQQMSGNDWVDSRTDAYANSYEYDANGNIKHLLRHDETGNTIDDLEYLYEQTIGAVSGDIKKSNRLYSVVDVGTSSTYDYSGSPVGFYYTDPADPSARHNNCYDYDEIGNLIKDREAELNNIEWNVYGKIKKIYGKTHNLEFEYDAMGHRISKIIIPLDIDEKEDLSIRVITHYVNDADGNILSTYSHNYSGGETLFQTNNIYGSSRLGIYASDVDLMSTPDPVLLNQRRSSRQLGLKEYEFSNHLGNVLTTISDRRQIAGTEFLAEIRTAQDYYPFGMIMPGRQFNAGTYRHGFNGKENDNEVKGVANSVDFGSRIYDSRLCRWTSSDPLSNSYPGTSPFVFALNTPISAIDPDGERVFFVISTPYASGGSQFEAAALTREREIRNDKSFDKAKDQVYVIDAYDLGKLVDQIREKIMDAEKNGFGQTVEVSYYGHNGQFAGPIGSSTTTGPYDLEDYTENSDDWGQMTAAGWQEINFNFDPNCSIFAIYGCQSAGFAEEVLKVQNTKYSAGLSEKVGPSEKFDVFNKNWYLSEDENVYFISPNFPLEIYSREGEISNETITTNVGVNETGTISGDGYGNYRRTINPKLKSPEQQ